LLSGCAEDAKYVDAGGPGTVVSVDKVDIQDFGSAAEALLNSLYDSPALTNSPRKPAVLAVSKITNDTSSQFDTDLLLSKIKRSITRSGKAEVSATVGTTQDALAKESKTASEFETGKAKSNTPDFILSGKILESKTNAGSTRQTSYVFQLSVIRVSSGTKAWSEEKVITKQGKKSSVGW
jgi:PBP1b-binding outer membrane lipoprotein LpoB